MEHQPTFVQFPHPGREHQPDRKDGKLDGKNGKSWNRGAHKRTFVKNPGRYVDPDTRQLREDELVFWCEWEPEADLVQTIDSPSPVGPNHIFEPYYVMPESYQGLQNTDPFVFGDQFYYTWCKQKTNYGRSRTQLACLEIGSLILFGSRLNWKFVLDTVFVVDRWIDHERENYKQVLKREIPQAYAEVTIAPAYQEHFPGSKVCGSSKADPDMEASNCGPGLPNRLYFGATYDRPYAGMYSFFPCLPYGTHSNGFARPQITLPDVITDGLNQSFKATSLDQSTITSLWNNIVDQVDSQGVMLGVWAAMPERRDGSGSKPIPKENLRGFHC